MSLIWHRQNAEYDPAKDDSRITVATIVMCVCFYLLFISAFLWLGNYIASEIDKMGMPR